jgi:ATP-dependent helicase/nuclease subunit A
MTARHPILDEVARAQIAASDPAASVFVSANAGSGKTHVLAQRVIRLLLDNVPPSRILCITYTKAAATTMANRVFGQLARWTALNDAALDAELRAVGEKDPDEALRARARRLFALALETPGGLKVQTIHAFCAHLLHLFPFEADVPVRFDVLDELAQAQLLDRLILAVLLDAAADPESACGRALATAIAHAADRTFREVLGEAITARDRLAAWIEAAGGVAEAMALLARDLGIDPVDSEEQIDTEIFGGSSIKASEWPAIAAVLRTGSKYDREQAERFASLPQLAETTRRETYVKIFCTNELSPRNTIVTRRIQVDHPELFERLRAEQGRICALMDRRRAVAVRDRTAALTTIAKEVLDHYRAEKERRGLLDYEDLIDKALLLLSNGVSWVHYKLDQGIDHVLIDEAQDTSPKQWAVIEKLVEEFFAGAGARQIKRTIFAVGDEKQSIFSFQGAAPGKFSEMRHHFETAHRRSELHFVHSVFRHSFRSGVNLLEAFDTVFSHPEAYVGLTADPAPTVHEGLPYLAPGLVEVWPLFKPDQRPEIEAWDAPFDTVSETSPTERLARKIAKTVAVWCRDGLRPGDVLILVRRRGPLFDAIIRTLKDAGVAVAGADRLVLTEHIAVMDLLALADALLLPDDDLALATALKSPLFGFSEEQLYELAWNRRGTLRRALREKGANDPQCAEAATRLDRLAEAAAWETPFAFFARLLSAEGGRTRILARLGHEAADALDEFLTLALVYERSQTPSLQGFVAWMRAAKTSIKRDLEMTRDEVRVMTVHGAKGLEAPIVVLAETTTPPQGWHPPRLLTLRPANAPAGAPPALVWAPRAEDDIGPLAAARSATKQAAEEEYRRLLYVAMTRAAQRLVVCGAEGTRGRPKTCWYDLVYEALKDDLVEEPADDGDGCVWRYRKIGGEPAKLVPAIAAATAHALPDWLRRDAPTDKRPPAMIWPARAEETIPASKIPRPPTAQAQPGTRAAAISRGILVHRLMQSLPDIAPERRARAMRTFLARIAREGQLSATEQEEIAAQVCTVLDDARFAALFAAGSRAEVPIAGHLGERMVVGQVDRLAVTAEAVLIADYKTNREVPLTVEHALARYPEYVRQLALYRGVLNRLYAERPVRAVLLFTEAPLLMEIPAHALDAALAAAIAAEDALTP